MNKKSSYLRRLQLPRTPAEWLEAVMNFIFFLCGMLAVGCVVLISVYMVVSGVPAIHKIGLFQFLFGTKWASTAAQPLFGILPFILSSIYGTLGATLIGVPIGLLTAVFLSKAADPKLRTVVVTAIELLSGIPSVVFGLLGMQVLGPAVASTFSKASGACLLSAIVVLSIMILPCSYSGGTALSAVTDTDTMLGRIMMESTTMALSRQAPEALPKVFATAGKVLRQGFRCLPAERHRGAVHYDPAQHRVRVGDGTERRAAGV